MTRDEALQLITQASNADTAPLALKELQGVVSEMFTVNETLTNTVGEQAANIATLRDTNMKLFLTQTEPIEEKQQEVEKTPDNFLDELVLKIKGD